MTDEEKKSKDTEDVTEEVTEETTEEAIKAESLDEQLSRLRRGFYQAFRPEMLAEPVPDNDMWLLETYEKYVIAAEGDKYWRIPYTQENDEVIFADRSEWQEVDRETRWVEKKAELEAKAQKSRTEDEEESKDEQEVDSAQSTEAMEYITAVKAHPDGKWGHLIGVGAPFGGPFGEGKGRDLDDEYFDTDTDFALHWYSARPILYHHGHDDEIGAEVVGREIKSWIGDEGAWVEAQIDKQAKYAESIWRMVKEGRLFFSSRSIVDLVKRLSNGKLKFWPVTEWTLTPTPANLLAAISVNEAKSHFKSAGITWPEEDQNDITNEENEMVDEVKKNEQATEKVNDRESAMKATLELSEEQKAALFSEFKDKIEQERAAKAAAEAKAEQEREALKAAAIEEYRKQLAEEARAKGLPFEHLVPGEEQKGETNVPAHIQRIAVMSRYDRLGDLDLAIRYYIQSRAAKMGDAPRPSERFFRALAVRANKMLQEEDEIPYFDSHGIVKSQKLPAFDINALVPWSDREDGDSYYVEGIGNVKYSDNVSPNGVKNLLRIGALKSDEAMYSTQDGYGDEWVPTFMAANLWRKIRLEAQVVNLFDNFDMPTQPYQYPTEGADPTIYGVSETADEAQFAIGSNMPIPDSKVGSAQVVFTAGKIGAISLWSEELNEDSIIAPQPQYRDQYGLAMAHGIDDVLINGDETNSAENISYYGSDIADTSAYLKIDGLRHQPLVTTTTDKKDVSTLTVDDLNAVRKLMGTNGINGLNPRDLVILCDPNVSYQFEDLDEVLTVDKFGSGATILTGQLGRIKNIPIIVSEEFKATDANGYINAISSNNTKGSFLIVNRRGIKVGWRRRPRIVVGQVPFSDGWYILALARLDIGFFGTGMVGMGYNVTV